MDEQTYIDKRIEDQIEWLDAKSTWNQRLFKRLRFAEIVMGSLIPVLAGLELPELVGKALVALLGASIAIVAAAISLWRFQELWVQYRATAEALKREKHIFLTRTSPYDGEDRFPLLVSRVEALLATENASWSQVANAPRPGAVPAEASGSTDPAPGSGSS